MKKKPLSLLVNDAWRGAVNAATILADTIDLGIDIISITRHIRTGTNAKTDAKTDTATDAPTDAQTDAQTSDSPSDSRNSQTHSQTYATHPETDACADASADALGNAKTDAETYSLGYACSRNTGSQDLRPDPGWNALPDANDHHDNHCHNTYNTTANNYYYNNYYYYNNNYSDCKCTADNQSVHCKTSVWDDDYA